MSAQPDRELPYEVIHLGGEAATQRPVRIRWTPARCGISLYLIDEDVITVERVDRAAG